MGSVTPAKRAYVTKSQSPDCGVEDRRFFAEGVLRFALIHRCYDTTEARTNLARLLQYASPGYVWRVECADTSDRFLVRRSHEKTRDVQEFVVCLMNEPGVEGVSLLRNPKGLRCPFSFLWIPVSEMYTRAQQLEAARG